MIIAKSKKKVLVETDQPELLLNSLPSSKQLEVNGKTYVAVPHNLDEARVLHNFGYQVPSPVSYYYEWSGQYAPFDAQRKTVDFLTLNPKAFCLNDMGTGKSLTTLWAFDYLKKEGAANKMLVVAPLSTLERTWGDEIFRHFMHLECVVLHGSKEQRLKLLKADADIYLINHDGVGVIKDALIKRKDIDVVAIDEIASFRNASTNKWKAMNAVIKDRPRVWGLTGTPTPNAPTDAWAQCRLICPENVTPFFSKFRFDTMRQVTAFKWQAKEDATEKVAAAMQPAIRFTRDSCVDLPPVMYENRKVKFSPQQSKLYKELVREFTVEYEDQRITAINEAVKLNKLLQVASGVAYDTEGKEIFIGAPEKLRELESIIEQCAAKVIVFVMHRGALKYVADQLRNNFKLGVINGAVPKHERDRIFSEFQRGKHMRVLVAQPDTMSHGLTLTASNTIVWFSPAKGTETYIQSNARITRPSQKLSQHIINLESCPLEAKIYSRFKNNQSVQGVLLDYLQHGI